MTRRFLVHFCLILLFAFTQAEVITHEISHLSDSTQQSQQDKKTPHHQCERCIGFSNAAASGLSSYFVFSVTPVANSYLSLSSQDFTILAIFPYQARAPPHSLTA